MRKTPACGLVVAVLVGAMAASAAGPAAAAPPRVAASTVRDGQRDVDPALTEIRITFDQPMDRRGMSIVGGGPTFPGSGRAAWADDRTLVISVKLEADRDYRLSINGGRFRNTRSAAGEPAEPYPIAFRTGLGKDGKPLTPEENRRAVEALRLALERSYSHQVRLKLDWAKLLEAAGPKLESARTPREFAEAAAPVLAEAKDLHLWLTASGQTVGTHRRDVPANADARSLRKLVPGWTQVNDTVVTGRFEDGVRYLLIASWDGSKAQQVEAAVKAIDEAAAAGAPGLIIDVRFNSGGSEPLAGQVAGRFVEVPVVYARHRLIADGKLGREFDRPLKPVGDKPAGLKVAVLMGPQNMSSCEAFLLMMRHAPRCTLVGARSYGSSGRPMPHELGNGVTAFVPSWVETAADGQEVEGRGIAPDVEVKAEAREFETADPVLEAALRVLRQK